MRARVIKRSRCLRLSTVSLVLPTRTYSRLRSDLILCALALGAARRVLAPVLGTMRVIAELLSGTAPFRQLFIAERTLHRVNRTANGIGLASIQNERSEGAAVFPFSFTDRTVWQLRPPPERSSDRIGGKAKTGNQLLATCSLSARHERVVNVDINIDIKESSKRRQRNVNESSKRQHRVVKKTSTRRQQIVTKRSFSSRSERGRFWRP